MVNQLLSISGLHDWRRVEQDYRILTRLLIERRWPQVEAVALALVDRRYLTYRDVRRIVGKLTTKD